LAGIEGSRGGTIELAGPEPIRMDELVRRFLSAHGDARKVVTDEHALYFGVEVSDRSLPPGGNPRMARRVSTTGCAAPQSSRKPEGVGPNPPFPRTAARDCLP